MTCARIMALGCLAALAAFPLAGAQDAADRTMTFLGHDAGSEYYFTVEGLTGRNPAVALAPGASYVVTFRNDGNTIHNLHFGEPIEAQTELLEPGAVETLAFEVPATASGEALYWCDPHRALGMEGVVLYSEEQPPPAEEAPEEGEAGEEETPLPAAVALAALVVGAAWAARRRA